MRIADGRFGAVAGPDGGTVRSLEVPARYPGMSLVATLIANPQRPAITDAVLAQARGILASPHPPRILHPAVAAEWTLDASPEAAHGLT